MWLPASPAMWICWCAGIPAYPEMGGSVRHGAEKHQQCGEYDRPGGYAAVPAARGGDGVLHLRGGREDDRKLLKDGLLRRRRYSAQAACALGSFGVRSLVHLTSFGPQFADLLNYPSLSVYSNGKALPVRQFFAGKSRALCSSFYFAVS